MQYALFIIPDGYTCTKVWWHTDSEECSKHCTVTCSMHYLLFLMGTLVPKCNGTQIPKNAANTAHDMQYALFIIPDGYTCTKV